MSTLNKIYTHLKSRPTLNQSVSYLRSRPIMVFDCDGVICDFVKGFYNWYNHHQYQTQYGIISRNPNQWNFDWTGDMTIINNCIGQYINTQPKLDLIHPNLPQLMQYLHQTYQIYIISHYSDRIGRLNNLDYLGLKQYIHYDHLICTTTADEKIQTIFDLKPDQYIEDAPHIIKTLMDKPIDWLLHIHVPTTYNYSNHLPQSIPNVQIHRYADPNELLYFFSLPKNLDANANKVNW